MRLLGLYRIVLQNCWLLSVAFTLSIRSFLVHLVLLLAGNVGVSIDLGTPVGIAVHAL